MAVVFPGRPETHKLLMRLYDGAQFEAGDLVRYEGPPNWKLEPLDAAGREKWAKTHADPERVHRENWLRGGRLGVREDARKVGV